MYGTVYLYMGVNIGGCKKTRKELMRRGKEAARERHREGSRTL